MYYDKRLGSVPNERDKFIGPSAGFEFGWQYECKQVVGASQTLKKCCRQIVFWGSVLCLV